MNLLAPLIRTKAHVFQPLAARVFGYNARNCKARSRLSRYLSYRLSLRGYDSECPAAASLPALRWRSARHGPDSDSEAAYFCELREWSWNEPIWRPRPSRPRSAVPYW